MINWNYNETITGKIEIPRTWTSSGILISLSNLTIPNSRKIGYLKIEILIDGVYFEVENKSIRFGNSVIAIPYKEYRLTFEPIANLIISYPNISIRIAEVDLSTYMGTSEPPKPEPPAVEIVSYGEISTSAGAIGLTSDPNNNIVWTDLNGNQTTDYGISYDLFVIGNSVYLMGSDNNPYVISVDQSSGWNYLSLQVYNDLKSVAKKIVTGRPPLSA